MAFKPSEPQDGDPVDAGDEVIDFIGARVFESVTIPRTKFRGAMRLVSRKELFEIKSAARKELEAAGFKLDAPLATASEEWDNELAVRMLAVAVRNPKDRSLELASLEEWRELDDDQIDRLFRAYLDFAARIDPIGSKPDLSEEEVAGITAAAKKKELDLLMSYGSPKLARFAMRSLTEPPTS